MGARCGIDLGTTYSAISWYDDFNKRVDTIDLHSADGAKIIRSVVYYPSDGSAPVVGDTAWNAAKDTPDRVIVGIKRSMGTGYTTPPIDGRAYRPQEVSSEILKTLVKDAEIYLGEKVEDVVITVPAYFGDAERAATEEAGRLAGLNVLGLLPEPHAAALAYSVEKVADITDRYILVYDLGGGTFDVTLIHASTAEGEQGINLNVQTLCKDGNRELGGLDWDRILAEIVTEKVQQQFGVDIRRDPKNDPILMDNCEKAKRHLTRTNIVSIIADLENHKVDVSKAEFEERSSDLLFTTQSLLEQVLSDAEQKHGVSKDRIDIMLVGGSSKMPMVESMIERVMGRPSFQHRNLELLVTVGAAYWAHLTQEGSVVTTTVTDPEDPRKKEQKEVQVQPGGLTDVSKYAFGVEVVRGENRFNAVIVPDGAEYNQVFEKEFMTSEDNMTEIPIQIYKGSSENISDCTAVIMCTISGLPPGRPKGQRVKVSLGYDGSGILRGKATDQQTGQEVPIQIDRSLMHK